MSGESSPLIAWDACVFLAWFKNETHRPLHAIEQHLQAVKAKKLTLLVSAVVAAELLDLPDSGPARTKLRQLLGHSNIQPVDVDFRIADKAAEFRERSVPLYNKKELKKILRAPDALIAATAVIYRAAELHSFDLDLITMPKAGELDGLRVCEPYELDGQKGLPL